MANRKSTKGQAMKHVLTKPWRNWNLV